MIAFVSMFSSKFCFAVEPNIEVLFLLISFKTSMFISRKEESVYLKKKIMDDRESYQCRQAQGGWGREGWWREGEEMEACC